MNRENKLQMVKAALKFVSAVVDKKTLSEFIKSPIFSDDIYLSEACILLRMKQITLDEFLILRTVPVEDLSLYLMDNDNSYINPTLDGAREAYITLDEEPAPFDEEDVIYQEKLARLRELCNRKNKVR